MRYPIRMTEEYINNAVEEFKNALMKEKFSKGKVNYSKLISYPDNKEDVATVIFSEKAWAKQLMLLLCSNEEIGWRGTVTRFDNTTFYIKDVMVYPQEVTGVTVKEKDEAIVEWWLKLDEETQNEMRFQAHSHVNMGVTPSATDWDNQEAMISQFRSEDDYMIFMVINKKLEVNMYIYDNKRNMMYDTDSIYVEVENTDVYEFEQEIKNNVKRAISSYKGSTGTIGYNYSKPHTYSNQSSSSSILYDYEDDDDDWMMNTKTGEWERIKAK